MVRKLSFILFLVLGSANASDYDDCVLKGMKGVQTSYAARAVETACRSKQSEVAETKNIQKFGGSISVASGDGLVLANNYDNEPDGYKSIILSNNTSNKTATLVALEIEDLDEDPNEPKLPAGVKPDSAEFKNYQSKKMEYIFKHVSDYAFKKHLYYYRVSLKSGEQTKLKFKTIQKSFSVNLISARGWDRKVFDFTSLSKKEVMPEKNNPLH